VLTCTLVFVAGLILVFVSADQGAGAISLLTLVVGGVVALVVAPDDVLQRLGLAARPPHGFRSETAGPPTSGFARSLTEVRDRLGAGALARQERQDAYQAERFLSRVQADYSERLAQLLHRSVHLSLGLDTFPGAVTQGLDVYLPRERASKRLPPGTTIREVFRDAGDWVEGRVLLLGEPGAGKTTMLLELAQTLASEVDADGFRIPVYVPLSAWTATQRPARRIRALWSGEAPRDHLISYIAERISEFYTVPLLTADRWLRDGTLLLLLDGLDEIPKVEDRSACVRLLNDLIPVLDGPLVVCSRRAEYEGLDVQLSLRRAISIRKLEEAELMHAIRAGGRALTGVRAVLQDDASLRDLCRSPLFLSMVAITYAGEPATRIRSTGSPVQRRGKLLDDYIDRQLLQSKQTAPSHRISQERNARRNREWLSWLARGMLRSNLTLCSMDQLGPTWLSVRLRLAALLPAAAAFYIGRALVSTWVGLEAGVFLFVGCAVRFPPSGRLVWSWRKAADPATLMLAGAIGLLLGEALGLLHAAEVPNMTIWPVHWTVPTHLGAALIGIVFGCPCVALILGFSAAPIVTWSGSYASLRRSALTGTLVFLSVWMVGTALFFAVTKVAGVSRFVVIRTSLPVTSSDSVNAAAGFVLYFAGCFGLYAGLGTAQGHLWMRVCIWATQRGPLRYVTWLNEMVSKKVLFRSGSAFGFIHRLLLDHVAGTVDDEATSRVGSLEGSSGDAAARTAAS
jgi:hypothetical protein